jgi:CheY-like chemotaxis protein
MIDLKPILLVEDSLNDAELVLHALKANNVANRIITFRHGGEVLDYLFQQGPYAGQNVELPILILLDLKMPKVDGLEVLRQIKAHATLRVIPIVMLTSSAEETDLVRSYQLGVNAYVVKPVEFSQFAEAIRQLGIFWAVVNLPPPAAAFTPTGGP